MKEFPSLIKAGILSSIIGIALTVGIDSYFWGKLNWPELKVLLFNTVDNQSHLWGVSPFHWYFTNAIPKSITVSIPFALVGLLY